MDTWCCEWKAHLSPCYHTAKKNPAVKKKKLTPRIVWLDVEGQWGKADPESGLGKAENKDLGTITCETARYFSL